MDGLSKDDRISMLTMELKRAKAKAETIANKTRVRTTRERTNNKRVQLLNQSELIELRKVIDSKTLLVKIAQESETSTMKSYKNSKENFNLADNALKETKVLTTTLKAKVSELERSSGQKDAKIAGLTLRVEEGIHNSSRDEMLEELLESKEKLLEDKLEELAIYKTKTEALGTELSTVKRHLASSTRVL